MSGADVFAIAAGVSLVIAFGVRFAALRRGV